MKGEKKKSSGEMMGKEQGVNIHLASYTVLVNDASTSHYIVSMIQFGGHCQTLYVYMYIL